MCYFSILVKSPCSGTKNNCSHLCLKSTKGDFSCACPTGLTLGSDKSNCKSREIDYEVVFADSRSRSVNHITKYVEQEGFIIKPLPLPSNETLYYPEALDYDLVEKYIYWIDKKTKKVKPLLRKKKRTFCQRSFC